MSRHYLSPKETHIKTISPKYTYNIIVGFKCYWIHWGRQLEPKYQSAQHLNSWKQLIRGLHEVWTEADKEWAAYLLLVEPTPCSILLKKRRIAACHLLQRDKSNQDTIFKLLNHLQLISALYHTGNHEFWYYSHSRFMHHSSKIMGNNQGIWEIKKCDGKPITMSIPVPKGLRE